MFGNTSSTWRRGCNCATSWTPARPWTNGSGLKWRTGSYARSWWSPSEIHRTKGSDGSGNRLSQTAQSHRVNWCPPEMWRYQKIKSMRTLTHITKLTFDYESLAATPPIDITPSELGFVNTDLSWKQFSTVPVEIRFKEEYTWKRERPAQIWIIGCIHALAIPRGPK